MKNRLLTALFLFSILTGKSALAQIIGNGGDVVVCERTPIDPAMRRKKIILYDYYEAAKKRDLWYDLGSDKIGYQEKVRLALSRIAKIDPLRYQRYRRHADTFFVDAEIRSPIHLPTVPDEDAIVLPKQVNCRIKQIAYHRPPQIKWETKRYFIDNELWDHLDNDSKAGLVLHEIIYREAREHGHRNSRGARHLNALLSSKTLSDIAKSEYQELLQSQIKFPRPLPDIRRRAAQKLYPNEISVFSSPLYRGLVIPTKNRVYLGKEIFDRTGRHLTSLADKRFVRDATDARFLVSDQSQSGWHLEVYRSRDASLLSRSPIPIYQWAILADDSRKVVVNKPLRIYDAKTWELLYQHDSDVSDVRDFGDRLAMIDGQTLSFYDYDQRKVAAASPFSGIFHFWFAKSLRFFTSGAGAAFIYNGHGKPEQRILDAADFGMAEGGSFPFVVRATGTYETYEVFRLPKLKRPVSTVAATSYCGGTFIETGKRPAVVEFTLQGAQRRRPPIFPKRAFCSNGETLLAGDTIAADSKGVVYGSGYSEFLRVSSGSESFIVANRSGIVHRFDPKGTHKYTIKSKHFGPAVDYIYQTRDLSRLALVRQNELEIVDTEKLASVRTISKTGNCHPILSAKGGKLLDISPDGFRLLDVGTGTEVTKGRFATRCIGTFSPDSSIYTVTDKSGSATRIYRGSKLVEIITGQIFSWVDDVHLVVKTEREVYLYNRKSRKRLTLPPGSYDVIDSSHILRTTNLSPTTVKSTIMTIPSLRTIKEYVGHEGYRPLGKDRLIRIDHSKNAEIFVLKWR